MSAAAVLAAGPRWTLRAALDRFLAVVQCAPSTKANHVLYAGFLVDYFGDRPVGDFEGAAGAALVAGYLARETGGGDRGLRERVGGKGNLVAMLSYSGIRQRLATLKNALYTAVYVGELASMPEPWPVVYAVAPERAGMEKPAERKRRPPMTARATGADRPPAMTGVPTLSTALSWMQRHSLRRRSSATNLLHAERSGYLLAFFGDRPLADFEGPSGYRLMLEYVDAEGPGGRGLKYVTIKKRLNTLRLALKEAHRSGAISGLPPWPELPADGEPRTRYLSYEEYVQVRGELTPKQCLWFDLVVWTGMHSSDVSATEWGMVDLGAGPGVGPAPGSAFWLRRNTKNRAKAAWLPMPDELRVRLTAAWQVRETKPVSAEPIAGHIDRSNFRNVLKRVCWRLKITRFTPTDCRRTCATWWIDRGGAKDGLKKWLGHSSTSDMVDRHYMQVTPAMLDSGVAALNRMSGVGAAIYNAPRSLGPVVAATSEVL